MTSFPFQKNDHGYRLLACDGSALNIARNQKDTDTYFQSLPTDINQLHLNVLYDLCEKRYTDVVIQPAWKEKESLAMTRMMDHYAGQKKPIFIAERGYETYNFFAHIQEKERHYLSCGKDGGGSMTGSFELPNEKASDHAMQLILTRKQRK